LLLPETGPHPALFARVPVGLVQRGELAAQWGWNGTFRSGASIFPGAAVIAGAVSGARPGAGCNPAEAFREAMACGCSTAASR